MIMLVRVKSKLLDLHVLRSTRSLRMLHNLPLACLRWSAVDDGH